MALYGSSRDVSFFRVINRELLHNIIQQEVGYYQISLDESPANVYGESDNGIKMYLPPVLIICLINSGDYEAKYSNLGPDFTRNFLFKFLLRDLMDQHVTPQIGDVLLWNNDYYKVNLVNENQFIVGKNPDYNYNGEYLDDFGASFSIILSANYTTLEKLGIGPVRL